MEERNSELYLHNLKCKILKLICENTDSIYIGTLGLDVKVDDNDNIFTLRLGADYPESAPIVIGYQGNDSEFLEFLKKEFKKRQLHSIQTTKGTLINEDSGLLYNVIEL